jgi:protein dithiol:quinone oxidoreductase
MSWRRSLFGIAALCVIGVLLALIGQYRFDMRPCPWCILQRFIFIVIALVAMVAAVIDSRPARRAYATLIVLLSACGAASALWQHFVAAKSDSCALTLADKVITALRLESLVPDLFGVTGSCADAAVSVFGVPFDFWSLALSILVLVLTLTAMGRIGTAAGRSSLARTN